MVSVRGHTSFTGGGTCNKGSSSGINAAAVRPQLELSGEMPKSDSLLNAEANRPQGLQESSLFILPMHALRLRRVYTTARPFPLRGHGAAPVPTQHACSFDPMAG